ncbi:MAG TPA: hypothetical protein VNX21_08435 [Candidatus Thermoplasmatota archaeon]|nr:hypothetical protein [Candidatus Thermoplasmatota archaeon]
MHRIALVVAASLLLATTLAVPTAAASQNPFCHLADFLCTVWGWTTETVRYVCDTAIAGGCPPAHG